MNSRIVLVNKTRFVIVLIVTFIICSLSLIPFLIIKTGPKNPYTKGLRDKIIVLDAGHGGVDPGAQDNGLKEKDITIKVVKQMEKLLHEERIDVIKTRDEESGIIAKEVMSVAAQEANLKERKTFGLKKRASMFLSIHVNSSPSKEASGAVVYYQNKNKYYKALAESIQIELNRLYIKKWTTKEANFVVINNTEMPSVLVEIGFITNPKDRKYLSRSNGQEMIAKAIINGLKNYGDKLDAKY